MIVKIEITSACNHKCFYCYKDLNHELNSQFMTKEQVDIIMTKLLNQFNAKELDINITGGEPFCNFEVLLYLVKLIEKYGIKFSINTNLTSDISLFLKLIEETNVYIPLFVSLPSLNKTIYEEVVNNNTYDIFLSNLKAIMKIPRYGLMFNVVTHKLNCDDVINTINKGLLLNMTKFKVTRLHDHCACKDNYISDNELLNLYDKILALETKNKNLIFRGAASCMPVCLFPNDKKYVRFNTHCNAKNDLCITTNGDVKGCIEFPSNFIVGNIFKESISQLMEKNYNLCNLPVEEYGLDCKQCSILNSCNGGCLLEHLSNKYLGKDFISLDDRNNVYKDKSNLDR